MAERIPMTPSGYAKLEAELRQLKTVDRRTISNEIEIARSHGDISENAEFHAAKERQSHIEGRIRIVEDKLARAQVILSCFNRRGNFGLDDVKRLTG